MRLLCVVYLSLLIACAGSPPTPTTVPKTHHLDASQFMFLVALEPPNAFTDESDRKSLWAALRGEAPTYRALLGNVDDVPFDYRVEFSFNHSDPSQPDTQFHQIRRWADRLPQMEQLKVQKAKTLVLIQGALRPLKNDMQVRFALATLLFLCERYNGVAFDLLTRKALSTSMLRTRLTAKLDLFQSIRFGRIKIDGKKGFRSLGLPMFGYPDVFTHSASDAESKRLLIAFLQHLHAHGTRPSWARLQPCDSERLDFGCLHISSRETSPSP